MSLKTILFLIVTLKFIYEMMTLYLVWKQRERPLPACVAPIYSNERYAKFIAYKKEYRKLNILSESLAFVLNSIYIFSNFFAYFQHPNPYLSFFQTLLAITLIDAITNIPMEYYATFVIEEKYGLNKQTKKEFFKDTCLEQGMNLLVQSLLFSFLIFVGIHMPDWTKNFTISYKESFFLILILLLCFFVLSFLLSLLSLVTLRLQYHFHELQPCPLKTKIESYLKECKKNIRHIKVYDESKKSNSKNAFLLKLGFYREFGIADNFLEENSEEELLAVLLHEIGHLKHKKNIWNYINYGISFCFIGFLIWLLPNGNLLVEAIEQINTCFYLEYTNPYLIFVIFTLCLQPILFFYTMFKNYISRKEEKEADYNSVDHGYGQALIKTFTKISQDELIDVNPHSWIEFLEYDHPGMATRISYIQARMESISRK